MDVGLAFLGDIEIKNVAYYIAKSPTYSQILGVSKFCVLGHLDHYPQS